MGVRSMGEQARIVGRVVRPSDEVTVFFVTSQSQPGKLYRVQVLRGRLVCPCEASIYTGRCAHRRLVHEVLAAELAGKRAQRGVVTIAFMQKPASRGSVAPHASQLNRTRAFSLMA